MSLLDDLIINADTISNNYLGFLNGTFETFTIPSGITKIRPHLFAFMQDLEEVNIHNNVTEIGRNAFERCTALASISIPDSVTSIGYYAFADCNGLTGELILPSNLTALQDHAFERTHITSVTVPGTVTRIGSYCFQQSWLQTLVLSHGVESFGLDCFYACSRLAYAYLPNTLTYLYPNQIFSSSNALETVVLENGWNISINLSRGTYTADTMVDMFNALADRTGDTANTLILDTNNLEKLTAEQKAIATNKNWNLA